MGKDNHSKADKKSRFNDESVKITHKGLSEKKSIKVDLKVLDRLIKEAKENQR